MTDVALDFGSVDGCQLAFRRVFGCNPGEYARTKAPIPLFIPYGVKFRELRKETVDMEAERIYPTAKKPARKVIIKRAFGRRSISHIARRWAATYGACWPVWIPSAGSRCACG